MSEKLPVPGIVSDAGLQVGPASSTGGSVPDVIRPVVEVSTPVVPLQALMESFTPLVNAYLETQSKASENEKEMHRRELELEEKALMLESKRDSQLLIATSIFVSSIIVMAAFLIFRGRDTAAIDLIKTIVAVIGAALGGYGLANRKLRENKESE